MKIGDLVEFYSTHTPFQDQYDVKNPGLVMDIIFPKYKKELKEGQKIMPSAKVMWSDGTFTKEFITYLRAVGS